MECPLFGKCPHVGSGPGGLQSANLSKPIWFNHFHDFWVGVGSAVSTFGNEELTFWRRRYAENSADVRKPMMKIQIKELDDQVILQVEGRLAGAFVPELESCWKAARANDPNRKISIDLKSVTCTDRSGRYLLQLMHSQGVSFLRAGLAMQDILEHIMEPKCKR